MAEPGLDATRHTIRLTAPDGPVIVADELGDPQASTVILLHGGGQTRSGWSATAGLLAASGYHVINYDARGHGESGWSADARYGIRDRVHDLRAVIAGVRAPFTFVGASMGGITAMQAVFEGIAPAALVLVDIVLQPDPAGVRRIFDFMSANPDGFASLEEAADAVAAYNPQRPRTANPEGLRKNLREGADGRFYWHWDPNILLSAPRDTEMLARMLDQGDWPPDIPVLLIRGTASDVVSDAGVAHLQSSIPGLEVLDVTGAGHMVAGDRNDPFTRGVLSYLERVMPVSLKD